MSIATKLSCESRGWDSRFESSLFLFFPLFAGGSFRVALSSLQSARGSPKTSTVLEDDVWWSFSRARSKTLASVLIKRLRVADAAGVCS